MLRTLGDHEDSDVLSRLREAFSFRRLRPSRGRKCSASRKACSSVVHRTSWVARCPTLVTSVRTATLLVETSQQSHSSFANMSSSKIPDQIQHHRNVDVSTANHRREDLEDNHVSTHPKLGITVDAVIMTKNARTELKKCMVNILAVMLVPMRAWMHRRLKR